MRKSRTPGSVRGVSGNGYPYRDIFNSVRIIQIACDMNSMSNINYSKYSLISF